MTTPTASLRQDPHVEIGSLIEAKASELVELWCARAVREQPSAARAHASVLRDHLASFLVGMGQALKAAGEPGAREQRESARSHGEQRWDSGWSIGELVRDYQILQTVVLEYLESALTRALGLREIMAIGVFVDDAIADSIKAFVANRDAAIQQNERARADSLREMNRRKDEFLAMLGHELRNPIDPIQTAATILRMQLDQAPESARKAIQVIERQCRHLVRLVDDLLDLARISQGRFELRKRKSDLVALVREAVRQRESYIVGRNHEVKLVLAEHALTVDVDPDRLLQVLGNLITNAAKYTKPGGHIEVAVRKEGDDAVIEVHDEGIGIAPEMLTQIFEAFTRGADTEDAYGGLGVGLTLVRRLVQQHGGVITCYSEGVGKGSTFCVRLPLTAKA